MGQPGRTSGLNVRGALGSAGFREATPSGPSCRGQAGLGGLLPNPPTGLDPILCVPISVRSTAPPGGPCARGSSGATPCPTAVCQETVATGVKAHGAACPAPLCPRHCHGDMGWGKGWALKIPLKLMKTTIIITMLHEK